jgi:hypothetical protein
MSDRRRILKGLTSLSLSVVPANSLSSQATQ